MVIVGLEEGNLPIYHVVKANSAPALAEEARTLAVMLSRARHGVLVTSSGVVPDAYDRPREQQPSRFLDKLCPAVVSDSQQIHDWLITADWQAIAAK